LWQPQECITWDTLEATFADCDGNGIVTTADLAVVSVNYNKLHSDFCKITIPDGPTIENNFQFVSQNGNVSKIDNTLLSGSNKVIPIAISNYNENIFGVGGVIDYNDLDIEIEGIKAGNLFGDKVTTHFYNNKDTKLAAFCIVAEKNYSIEMLGNNVAELYIIENNNTIDNIAITDFITFDSIGNVKKLEQTYTSIELEKEAEFTAKVVDGKLILNNVEGIENISVLNYLGIEVANFIPNTTNTYNINKLSTGIYFAIAKTFNKFYTAKIVVIE
jgi:hypothetical protein